MKRTCRKAMLVHRDHKAHVLQVTALNLADFGRDAKLLFSGTVRECELFARGLAAAGVVIRTAACDEGPLERPHARRLPRPPTQRRGNGVKLYHTLFLKVHYLHQGRQTVLLPIAMCDYLGIDKTFAVVTGLPRNTIVQYGLDDLFDANGDIQPDWTLIHENAQTAHFLLKRGKTWPTSNGSRSPAPAPLTPATTNG